MPEFLHELVKKREERDEWRTLMPFTFSGRNFFERASQEMPAVSTITYTSNTINGFTEHSIEFPNIGGWIQSTVCINTPANIMVRNEASLYNHAWDLLSGHPCRPNFSWRDGTYTCRGCSATYSTLGLEWSLARV